MTKDDHVHVIAMEECNEVAHRIAKAARFGMDQIQEDADDKPEENPDRLNNKERILIEFYHLVAMLETLGVLSIGDRGELFVDREVIRSKQLKVEHYLRRSAKHGRLS